MTFAFPLLLGGLLLAGLPVLLHLLMRQKPKTLLFPAFRFLVQRHKTNLTKLRLRHLLLMALRVLLLVAVILALSQPKFRDNPWSLPGDQAAAAVFVFDTSASMEYTVAASQTRLKDAQKRALEMLSSVLPANSEVVILDSADSTPVGKGEWLAPDKAAARIGQLKLQPANAPVSARVAVALELLARIATTKDESQRNQRARVLCVFSDRTIASWDVADRRSLQALANAVPPSFERLQAMRSGLAEQQKLLAELGQRLPALSQSYPEQALIGPLETLGERLAQLRADEYPETGTQALVATVRSKQQELLASLEQSGNENTAETKDYRDRLAATLRRSLQSSAGFNAFFVDVGVDKPADLALSELQLGWELPESGVAAPQLKLRVEAQATGEDFHTTMACAAAPGQVALEIKAGRRDFALFGLQADQLKTGYHQVKATAKPSDQLASNNTRYLTFSFRPVLVIADQANEHEAATWAKALDANHFGGAYYRSKVITAKEFNTRASSALDDCAAVFLYSVAAPDAQLWKALSEYVDSGGGIGVIPPGADANLDAYNGIKAAQDLLPGKLEKVFDAKATGADWDWNADVFKHRLLHPFQEWRQGKADFVVHPRGAMRYWQVEPRKERAQILVRYADGNARPPAILERLADTKKARPGRVVLLTTPPGWDTWNNYGDNSFYLTLARQLIGYLSGDADRPSLNFLCGHAVPQVPVRVATQAVSYKLYREGPTPPEALVGTVTIEAGENEARLPLATEPGNYLLRSDDTVPLALFSVNLPAQESDLAKVARGEIEAVLGPETLVPIDASAKLKVAVGGSISQPWEMMPVLMLGLLILLAVENLLANKFYRKEPC